MKLRKKALFLSLGFLACIFLFAGCAGRALETGSGQMEEILGQAPGNGTEEAFLTAGSESAENAGQENMDTAEPESREPEGTEMEGTEPEGTETAAERETEEGIRYEDLTITISFAGDVTLGNYKGQGYDGTFREMYDTVENPNEYFLQSVKEIFEADDMTLVNLEGPLTFSEDYLPGKEFNMRGDPGYVDILVSGGVEAVSMGNNHRMDYKEQGCRDTVEALEDAGIVYAYDDIVGIYEVKGVRVGFVSVNEVYDGGAVEKFLEDGIQKLTEEGVEIILACCHWGVETHHYPEQYQEELGRKCIDWGADLVIGCHPHVLQGVDYYKGKYIVYSLGNFCFGGNRNPKEKDSMIFQQTFTFSPEGETQAGEAKVIPCSISSVKNRNDYQPTPLEGEEYDRILELMNTYSRDFHVAADENGILSYTGETEGPEG